LLSLIQRTVKEWADFSRACLEESLPVCALARAPASVLFLTRCLGLPDNPRNKSPKAGTNILTEFNPQNLDVFQLLVQEFDDSPEFARKLISDKQQTDLSLLQAAPDVCPETLDLLRVVFLRIKLQEASYLSIRLTSTTILLRREGSNAISRPVYCRVGCILKHLPDDLTPDPCVRGTLDFNKGRYGLLIEKQMVYGPAIGCVFPVWNTGFATNKEPPNRLLSANLFASQDLRVRLDKRLEQRFAVIRHAWHSL